MTQSILDIPQMTIPVDREHGALRLSIVLIFLVSLVVIFMIVNLLIPSEGINLIGGIIALAAAGLLARGVENALKKRWPSGRAIQTDEQGVRFIINGQPQTEIRAGEPMEILCWKFEVKRRTRVPKGWFVVACALNQDEIYLPVYTFASPQQAQALEKLARFTTLPGENEKTPRGGDTLRAAGELRRLRTAESFRWNTGAEMSLAEFEQYIDRLNGQFSQWMPSNR